jgi:hypothetical protein
MRFDTMTAIEAMKAGTQLSAELEFLGSTLTGSTSKRGIKFTLPKLYIDDAGDPEIGGPDEILKSEVTFNVLKDVSSTGGYALKAEVTNLTTSY